MDTNTFILAFSLLIFVAGTLIVLLNSREFNSSAEYRLNHKNEGGLRATFFDALYEFFSESGGSSPEEIQAKKAEIKKMLDEID